MANWIGASRTNYFRVKDVAAFKQALSRFDLEIWHEKQEDGSDVKFAVGAGGDGNFPNSIYNEETREDEEVDLVAIVAEHLAEGEVAVFMETGAEKLRYVTGWAVAVNHKGERLEINIDNIYDMVKERWGVQPTLVQYNKEKYHILNF